MTTKRSKVLRNLPAAAVICIIAAAGILKLIDLAAFGKALGTWRFIPQTAVLPLAIMVPCTELGIAGLWLLGRRRLAALAALGLLVCFTLFYFAHLAFAAPPDCGCMGKLALFEDQTRESQFIVGRNVALLMLLGWGLWLTRNLPERRSELPRRFENSPPQVHSRPSAFTLLELLIVISVIALLIALALPSLRGVKHGAVRTVSLSNLRSHAANMNMYTSEWADMFPYFTDPDSTWTVYRRHDRNYLIPYFAIHVSWNVPMSESYYEDQIRHRSFNPPGADPWYFTHYWYSASFIARPEFWNEYTRTGPAQWRPTRNADVSFPDRKGLLLDYETEESDLSGNNERRLLMASVDGAAASFRLSELSRPYPNGEGDWPGSFHTVGWKGMHTIDGVRGRDR